jgi:hypothetical protein
MTGVLLTSAGWALVAEEEAKREAARPAASRKAAAKTPAAAKAAATKDAVEDAVERVGRDGRRRTLPAKAAAGRIPAPKTDDDEVAQLIGDLLNFTFTFSQKITAWGKSGHDCGEEARDALMFTIHQCADEILRLAQAIDGR